MTAAGRTVVVTGSSSGIGKATAAALRDAGWRVFATARRPDPSDPDALPLDVTTDASVNAAVAEVLTRTGRIDAIVNNAGVDILGAAEETTVAEAEALFATNFFGVHRLTRAVLPVMRRQGGGRVVTVGSIAGFLPTPFSAFYSATKHALEGYTDTLAYEVAPFGIRCTLVQPGFIRTDLRSKKGAAAERIDAYADRRAQVGAIFDRNGAQGIPPARVADAIVKTLTARRPRARVRVGTDAALLGPVRRFLPDPLFRAGMRRLY